MDAVDVWQLMHKKIELSSCENGSFEYILVVYILHFDFYLFCQYLGRWRKTCMPDRFVTKCVLTASLILLLPKFTFLIYSFQSAFFDGQPENFC